MFGIIVVLIFAAVAVVAALTLASENFADGVSRYAEAAFDAVEYRLAMREKRAECAEGAARVEAVVRVEGGGSVSGRRREAYATGALSW